VTGDGWAQTIKPVVTKHHEPCNELGAVARSTQCEKRSLKEVRELSEPTRPGTGDNSSSQAGAKSGIKPGSASSSSSIWNLLLLLPYVGLLWLPFYAKAEPQVGGFPFFYWYQFLWVFVTMVLIEVVYRRTR
jgi:Protein of unknown function (DUF3311)